MAEVAALGLKVEGVDGVDRATDSLDRLAGASKGAETSAAEFASALEKLNRIQRSTLDVIKNIDANLLNLASSSKKNKNETDKAAEAAKRLQQELEKNRAAYESIRGSLDPAFAATKKYKDSLSALDKALSSGAITSKEHAQAVALVGKEYEKTSTFVGRLTGFLQSARGVAATLISALGINQLRNYADTWSDMQSQVGAATGDMAGAAASMQRLTDIANASYSPLQQTVEGYARNVTVLRDLGKSSSEAADFTESLNHMLVLTATRGERAASVQNALSKAMAVGKLQAEGLETILANGGEVAQALAAQLGTTVSGLRGLASEGKITGQVIADAIINPLETVRDRAAEMPATMADAFVRVNNNLTEFVGRIDKATGASSAIAEVILNFADGIRTAGSYVIAFGSMAAPVFEAVGSAISFLGQGADIALAAVAGFAAPALIGGVIALTSALAVGLVGALKTVAALMLANPIGLLVGLLAAAGYAVYKFRDEIQQAIGVDVVGIARTSVNYVIGAFVGAYELITAYWKNFPEVIGATMVGAVNMYIRYINTLVSAARDGINEVIGLANSIPGVNISALASGTGELSEMDNPYAKAAMKAATDAVDAARLAFNKDWLAGAFSGFTLSEPSGIGGDGGGGGLPPALDPKKLKAALDAATENAKAIDELGKSLYLAGLEGEALALTQARMSLNQYATPEQIAAVENLASALYKAQENAKARGRFGDDPDKYIMGANDTLSGGAFDDQVARYAAEEEKERERYASQLERLNEARMLQIETNLSYDELEAQAAQQHADRMSQIDTARNSTMLTAAGNAFGALAGILKASQGEQSSIYRAMFAASKAFAVANATINAYDAISKAWASATFPLNLAAVAATAPQVMALVGAISGTGLSGMAHDGIDSVPNTGTWLLEKGERVTTANTSARMDSVLDRIDSRMRSDASSGVTTNSGETRINVNLIESQSRAGQVESTRNSNGDEELNLFVADIRGGGERSQILESTYGLSRVGV